MKTLLLWDIDGTLITSGGAGERALVQSLRQEFGVEGTLEDVELAGRTDRWIARRILAKFAISPSPENITRYLEGYLRSLPAELHNPEARPLPGVRALVDAVAQRRDFAQGLLTGNLEAGARIKLSHHQLWVHFPFGAYADDAELRNELGPHALRRAAKHYGVDFPVDRVFVIGDTPHDIECGRVIGAKTIAVATGNFTAAQLREHQPTAVFNDLSDTAAVMAVLTA